MYGLLSNHLYKIMKIRFIFQQLWGLYAFQLFLQRRWLLWLPAQQNPSEKGSTLKGKNLLPNSFLLELTPFQEGGKNKFDIYIHVKMCPVPIINA